MDELRDYRFYAKDLIHPNELAIEYVWNKLVETCFDEETKNFVLDMKHYKQMQQHRILHPGTPESQRFEALLITKNNELKKKYQTVNF